MESSCKLLLISSCILNESNFVSPNKTNHVCRIITWHSTLVIAHLVIILICNNVRYLFHLLVALLLNLRYLTTNSIYIPDTSNIRVLGNHLMSEEKYVNLLYCWIWRFANDVGELPGTHMVVAREINIWVPDTTNIWVIGNRSTSVKEVCKSITLVELKILQQYRSIACSAGNQDMGPEHYQHMSHRQLFCVDERNMQIYSLSRFEDFPLM